MRDGTTGDVSIMPYTMMARDQGGPRSDSGGAGLRAFIFGRTPGIPPQVANGTLWFTYGALLDNATIALPNVSAMILGGGYVAAFVKTASPDASVLPHVGASAALVSATVGAAALLPVETSTQFLGYLGCGVCVPIDRRRSHVALTRDRRLELRSPCSEAPSPASGPSSATSPPRAFRSASPRGPGAAHAWASSSRAPPRPIRTSRPRQRGGARASSVHPRQEPSDRRGIDSKNEAVVQRSRATPVLRRSSRRSTRPPGSDTASLFSTTPSSGAPTSSASRRLPRSLGSSFGMETLQRTRNEGGIIEERCPGQGGHDASGIGMLGSRGAPSLM